MRDKKQRDEAASSAAMWVERTVLSRGQAHVRGSWSREALAASRRSSASASPQTGPWLRPATLFRKLQPNCHAFQVTLNPGL